MSRVREDLQYRLFPPPLPRGSTESLPRQKMTAARIIPTKALMAREATLRFWRSIILTSLTSSSRAVEPRKLVASKSFF